MMHKTCSPGANLVAVEREQSCSRLTSVSLKFWHDSTEGGKKKSEKDFRSSFAFWKSETCSVEFGSLLPFASDTINDAQSVHMKVL